MKRKDGKIENRRNESIYLYMHTYLFAFLDMHKDESI